MAEKKKFVIIDTMALAYKGYFAFINRPLTTSSGEPTSAVYGFINQLLKIIGDTKPDYLAAAFDAKEKTFRHEMYDKYKSSRAKMPEDMIPQIDRIRQLIEAFEIPVLIKPGYEADDIIGTAAVKAEKEGFYTLAVTPDKDYVQLVTENVNLAKPGKSQDEIDIINLDKVNEIYGFSPEFMVDYLALVGDSSDDIPGVAGVGPKTATPLLQEFGHIEDIYANIDKISKKGLVNKLTENEETAYLSKKLATIVCDVPIEIDFDAIKFHVPDVTPIINLLNELEFKAPAARVIKMFSDLPLETDAIIEEKQKEFSTEKPEYKLITSQNEAMQLAGTLQKQNIIIFDTETDSLNTFEVNLFGASFCYEKGKAYFVAVNPFVTNEDLFAKDLSDRLSIDSFIKIFKPLFENKNVKKVCQNGKYDIAVLNKYNIEVESFYFDTMLASYVLDPDQKHGMDALAQNYLNYDTIKLSELIGEKKDPTLIVNADINKLSDYAAEDADITFQLYEFFNKKLKEEGLEKLAHEVEFPLVPVLRQMEFNGIKIDVDGLREFSKQLEISLEQYTKQIYSLAGAEFNINSTKQMQEILFTNLQLKPTKKTKTGYSTDARSLEMLRGEHDIIDIILDYRQVSKLKSTYADSLPKLIEKSTGRIHTTYNQTVASTGRLSSLDPNLQNIPIRTELGKEIRKAFIPTDESYTILSADYSQIELRIMASICSDPGLTEAFKKGEDIHKSTAALVFQVPLDEVTADMRRKAKEVNFGILYGIGAFGLASRLQIPRAHAQEVIDTYFETFKNVKAFMEDSVEQAKTKGYAETLLGRRRYLRNINSSNRVIRQFEERVAINMPIQGTAADMIKLAMIKIHNELFKRKTKTKMVLQVHDELVFDAHKDELNELQPMIIELMQNALPLEVPVLVEAGTGANWLEAH